MMRGEEKPWIVVNTGVFTSLRVGQRHKVIVAVDQVKLRGVLKGLRDVQVFGYLGIDRAILFIAPFYHRMQTGRG